MLTYTISEIPALLGLNMWTMWLADLAAHLRFNQHGHLVLLSSLLVLSAHLQFWNAPVLELRRSWKSITSSSLWTFQASERITWVRRLITMRLFLNMSLDHNLLFTPFIASSDSDSLDALFRGTKEEISCKTFLCIKRTRN